MKKYIFAFFVLALFLVACGKQAETGTAEQQKLGGTPEKTEPAKVSDAFKGFMAYKAGSWVEWETQGETTTTMRMEVISFDNGVLRMQTSGNTGGNEFVSQMWMNTNNNYQPSKYVMKSGGQVLCMDVKDAPAANLPDEKNYENNVGIIGTGTYTTPTGKTVSVTKFKDADSKSESWVSGEVPFGLAKTIDPDGKITTVLKDFGTSGAASKISDVEIANCKDVNALMQQAQGAQANTPSNACDYCNQLQGDYKQQCLASC